MIFPYESFDVGFMEALACGAEEYMFGAISVTSFETIYTKRILF